MIIEFTIKNFRSFKDEFTLSLEAENLPSKKDKLIETSQGVSLLPTAGIFGANASGKSNIFKALSFLKQAMTNSDINNPTTESPFLLPFELDATSSNQPIFMQIILWDGVKNREYRYGFKIDRTEVVEEWLYMKSKAKTNFTEKNIFLRQRQEFKFGTESATDLKDLAQRVNPKLLAIPIFAQFNHHLSLDLFSLVRTISILDSNNIGLPMLAEAFKVCNQNPEILTEVNRFINKSDTGIQSIQLDKAMRPLSEAPSDVQAEFNKQGISPSAFITKMQASTRHKMHGKTSNDFKVFALLNHESAGTVKLFILTTLLIQAFKTGGIFVVDELDAGLHPLLVQAIINQLENKRINSTGVQLIYSSHATYLLSSRVNLRRDQIWFTEKNDQEESILKCLSEYKTRGDYEISRNYLIGRFGGVPILNFDEIEVEAGE